MVLRSRVAGMLDRLYRALLLTWPPDFRAEYGRQMREAFRDRCQDAIERGGMRLPGVVLRAVVDALRNGLAERWSGSRSVGAEHRRGPFAGLSGWLGAGPMRQSLRRLGRAPTFAAATIASVGLGVGAFASVASVADGVLLDRLPYEAPEQLVWIWRDYTWFDLPRGWLGGPDIASLREHDDVFEDVVAFRSGRVNLAGADGAGPEEARLLLTSDGFFDVLGAQPLLGRGFQAGESLPGAEPVVVLGYDIWRRRWGGDPGVIGERIMLDGEAWTVVGVTGPDFHFVKHVSLGEPEPADIYATLRRDLASLSPGFGGFAGLARIRPGATRPAVEAALAATAAELGSFFNGHELRLWAVDLRSDLVGGIAPALIALAAAAFFLLLILTANLATLLYGRAEERRRDIAIRSALGGNRAAAVASLVSEALIVVGAGCVGGLVMARLSVNGLLSLAPASLPRREAIDLDASVVAVTAGLAIAMGLIASLGPAIRVSRRGAAQILRASDPRAGGGHSARTRSTLVILQVALSLMLLVGAGLVGRSAVRLLASDPGFDPEGVLTWRVPLSDGDYAEPEEVAGFHAAYLSRIGAIPGVLAVGASSALPLTASTDQGGVTFPGAEGNSGNTELDSPLVDDIEISPGYFETMRIGLLEGREFSAADAIGSPPVAIIDRTLAEHFFPGGNATGRPLLYMGDTLTVVGVVDHARQYSVQEDGRGQVYRSAAQYPEYAMFYVARTAGDPLAITGPARSALQTLDAALPMAEVRPARDLIGESLGRHRLTLLLLAAFAAGALLLAAMGIYGVVAGGVIRRTREIGIRLALGASRTGVLRVVATEGARVVIVGLALGLIGALATSRILGSLLFGIRPDDPLTYAAVAAFLGLTAAVACLVPALRAVRIPPTRALRGD